MVVKARYPDALTPLHFIQIKLDDDSDDVMT